MKWIKTYTLYERVSKETKIFESGDFEIEEVIKELFFELEDAGFDVEVEPNYTSPSRDKVFQYYVTIKKQWSDDDSITDHEREYYGDKFILRDVLDSIVMCSGYLKDNGYEIWDAYGTVITARLKNINLGYIAGLDPKINFQKKGPDPIFDIELTKLILTIRKIRR